MHLPQQSTLRGGSPNVTIVTTSFSFSSIDPVDEKEKEVTTIVTSRTNYRSTVGQSTVTVVDSLVPCSTPI